MAPAPRKTAKNSETVRIAYSSIIVVIARTLGTAATFAYTLLMARLMSPNDVGEVWAIWSGSYIAASFATLNIGSGAVREVVAARASGDDNLAAGFILASHWTLAIMAPITIGIFILASWWRSPELLQTHWLAYLVTAVSIPILGWGANNASHANALRQTLKSQTPRILVRPAIFLVTLLLYWANSSSPTVDQIVLIYFFATVASSVMQYIAIRSVLADVTRNAIPNTKHWGDWIVSGLFLSPVKLLGEYLKNVIILFCALALPSEEIGLLAVSLSLVNFLNFGIASVDLTFGPKVSAALARNNNERIQHFLAIANILKAVPTVLGSIVLILLFRPLLSLFGQFYVSGEAASTWLLLIPLSRAIFGDSTLVMQVRGHRREVFWSCLLGLAAMCGAVVLGGKLFGVQGAAAGCALTMTALQVVRYFTCLLATGIDTSLLGALRYGFRLVAVRGGK